MKKFMLIILFIITISVFLSIGYFIGVKKSDSNVTKSTIEGKKLYHTYMIGELTNASDNPDTESIKVILEFNNNDLCTGCRIIWNFVNEDIAKSNYDSWKLAEVPNLKIEGTTVMFNDTNIYYGKSKESIKENEGPFIFKDF